MRKCTVLLVLLLCQSLFMKVAAQEKEMSVKAALDKIGAVYETSFIYDDNLFDKEAPVKFTVPANTSRNIGEVLKELLYPRGYLFLYVDKNHYTIVKEKKAVRSKTGIEPGNTPAGSAPSNTKLVSGTVIDEQGQPVPGATVVADGFRLATSTSSAGAFRFYVPDSAESLSVSYVGAQPQRVQIPQSGAITVRLTFDPSMLKEVTIVSTGLQQLPKERSTGSFSIVSKEMLEKTPTPNVLQRLETQVPGLLLQFNDGDNTIAYNSSLSLSRDPEVKSSIYTMSIRGTSTLNGGRYPLVVVDGFPVETDIRSINPNDIEQITVLKDAAAASIWGIRAANGVIVIQTKKGKLNQKPSISFNTNIGLAARSDLNKQNLITAQQMLDFEREVVEKNLVSDNSAADFGYGITEGVDLFFKARRGEITQDELNERLAALGASTNYDEYGRYFLQGPSTQNYNLSVSGGGAKHTYFASASYAKELPVARGTSAKRFTLTANQRFKIANAIDFNSNLRLTTINSAYNGIGMQALVNRQFPFQPYDHVVDANGDGIGYYQAFNRTFSEKLLQRGYLDHRYNYLQEQQNLDNTINETNFAGNFSLTAPVPFVPGLTADVLYSIEKSFINARNYQNPNTFAARSFMNMATSYDAATQTSTMNVPYGGILSTQQTSRNNYALRGQLTYAGSIGDDHQLNGIAGAEIRQTYDILAPDLVYGWNDYSQVRPLVPSTYPSIYGSDMTLNPAGGYSDQKRRFLSYFSNLAYTYKGRYTISGSVRYDDYNNFGLDVKYRAKPFWSSGASWNIRQESFMSNVSWLSELKLRATYGLSGNIDRNARPEATLSATSGDYLTGMPYSTIVSPANAFLRWETTRTMNIGTDFSFFNHRLSGSFEFYTRKGRDLFAEFDTDPTLGFTRLTRNTATLESKGFETMLSGDIVRAGAFTWNAVLTFAYNENEITDSRYGIPPGIINSPASSGPIKDYPVGYVMAYRFAGLDNTGQPLIYNQKNEKLTSSQRLTDIHDLRYMGVLTPRYFGAFSHTFRYKSWTAGAQLTYRLGYVFRKMTIPLYVNRGMLSYNLNGDIAKRWRQPGDEAFTDIPGVTVNPTGFTRYMNSDINVLPGDYIRLQQVSLGYTLTETISRRLGLKNLSVEGVVRNLGLVWRKNNEGIDPDFQVGSTGSSLRLAPLPLYTLSINANF